MPVALVLSSFVAASRIGGSAQQYALAAHRIDPVLAPTAIFGRSPALGGTGEVTAPEIFRRMLGDIEADAIFDMVDLVITGHFSLPEQVAIAEGLLARIRERSERRPTVVVDPIMGDAPKGLYVRPDVAEAIAARLVPLADWITPNLWELGRLAGTEITDAAAAAEAARRLGRPALVTSTPGGAGEIGLLLWDGTEAMGFFHPRADEAPNGTGDLVTASFGAGLVEGLTPGEAAERAARAAAEAIAAAHAWSTADLPLVAIADRLVRPTAPVRIARIAGARTTVRLEIEGRVQGVGYRWWTVETARRLGLAGWVRNRRDGAVEVLALGEAQAVEALVAACRQGPAGARVSALRRLAAEDDGSEGFEQRATT